MSVSYYDLNADAFFHGSVNAEMGPLHERFLARVPSGGAILDVGCGSGRDARAFTMAGYNVTAFDASAAMVTMASAHAGLHVLHMTFDEVEWSSAFDGVWACASLLHVAALALPATLARLARALRPGGVLFASFKNGDGERELSGRRFTDLRPAAVRSLLIGAGLQVLEVWSAPDVRPGRPDEIWVSALGRKPLQGERLNVGRPSLRGGGLRAPA
jgi:2-polyprenyl-3-methyl-5-hydroxy-6-metoxy-1,4-benzoquinol methylase